LSQIEERSHTWAAVTEYVDEEISQASSALEDITMGIDDTQFTRGYIKALRELKNLPTATNSPIRDAVSINYE